MHKSTTIGATALTIVLLSGTAIADDMVYSGFPVTVNGYTGKKTTSVSYTGQIARHVLHDSLKKLANSGNGKPNPELKAKMLSYYKNKDKGRMVIAPKSKGLSPSSRRALMTLARARTLPARHTRVRLLVCRTT